MKWFKRSLQVMLMVAVLLTEGMGAQEARQLNNAGSYSEVCGTITEETESWVLSVFGEHDTLEELLWALDRFACENFTYTTDALGVSQRVLQHFNMQHFIESGFRGICFDFACFCKNVVLIWCQAQGEDVQVFVCDIKSDLTNGHSYNYFTDSQGNCWYMDVTSDSTNYKKGDMQGVWGPVCLGDATPEEFNNRLYPDGYWFSLMR